MILFAAQLETRTRQMFILRLYDNSFGETKHAKLVLPKRLFISEHVSILKLLILVC